MSQPIITVPSLVHGVSQQAQSARYLSQADLQENAYPSIVTGLSKRQPLNLLAELGELGMSSNTLVHLINRSVDERYVVLFDDQNIRVFQLDGTEVPVKDDTNGPSFDPDFSYLDLTADQIPQKFIKPLTIADYTIVLNRAFPPQWHTDVTDPPFSSSGTRESVLAFVRAGNYKTNYKLLIGGLDSGAPDEQFQISTWDGNSAAVNQQEIWTITLWGATGATGSWAVTVNGITATASILNTDTLTTAAVKIRNAINSSGIAVYATATTPVAGQVTLTAVLAGQDITPTSIPTSGWHQQVYRAAAGTLAELASIKTDDIAQELANQINSRQYAGPYYLTAERAGSVLKIVHNSINGIDMTIQATDSTGTNTSIYGFADKTPDFDLLPLTAPHGHKLKVTGDTVDPADDYYVSFVTDAGSGFGPGHWEEALGFRVKFKFDHATMPWSLVRKQDDELGTITGTPGAKYFNWQESPWVDRHVGDDDTAPVPSILPHDADGRPTEPPPDGPVGTPISDLAFHRNRLVLISGQNAVFSGVNEYFDLYRTTTRALVDSDPIDIQVPHTSVVSLNHALTLNERLVLFADQGMFVVNGEPTLTPTTVQCSLKMNYQSFPYGDPIVSERGLFFGYDRGDFTGIREMIPSRMLDGQFDAPEITQEIPQYIPGDVTQMAASNSASSVFVLADGDVSTLYVYKYALEEDGSRRQSAWSRYPLGAGTTILGLGFIDQRMIVVLRRQGLQGGDTIVMPWSIEAMDVVDNLVDDGADYLTYLDQRILKDDGVYLPMVDQTRWTLVNNLDQNATYQAVTQSLDGTEGGDVHALTVTSAHTLNAKGNLEGVPVWIGRKYTMRYRFSRIGLKRQDSAGNQRNQVTGRLQVIRGTLSHDRSCSFEVLVTPQHGDAISYPFDSDVASDATIGEVNLSSEDFQFGVMERADRVQIELVNDTPLPANFQSAEFACQHNARGYQPYN